MSCAKWEKESIESSTYQYDPCSEDPSATQQHPELFFFLCDAALEIYERDISEQSAATLCL